MTVTVMRIFVPGDGDGEKKHDYTVFFTGAGYVSPLVPDMRPKVMLVKIKNDRRPFFEAVWTRLQI